uniref:Expressed conserved protein n=1 Tax=Echinococcus granulosus TaxID=6210 RepID=A0A068WJC8_ECHGR|nr:hypothetical protein EgrG_000635500 [Echinococcus granulosus]
MAARRLLSVHETINSAKMRVLKLYHGQTKGEKLQAASSSHSNSVVNVFVLEHHRNRENELFQENRELQNLVSVPSARMLRFAHRLRQKRRLRQLLGATPEVQLAMDVAVVSLDGGMENDFSDTSSDSSLSEVRTSVQSQLVDMERHRRQPANVQHLLLERSLHPVRHRLICRVHRLSRRLWRKIKATDRPEERSSTSPTTLSSVEVVEGNVLPPESAVTDPKSSQDEMVVFENKMVPRKFLSDDSGVGITKVTFTPTPRRLGQKPQQGEHFVMTIHVEGIFYEKILSLIALTVLRWKIRILKYNITFLLITAFVEYLCGL